MKRVARWGVLVAIAASGCAAPGEAPVVTPAATARATGPATLKAPALKNPGFELEASRGARCASEWSCTMHSDPKSFRFFADDTDGRRSFCVEPVKSEPWALVTQSSFEPALRGTRLRFSIDLRLAAVAGAGAGPWAQVQRSGERAQTHQKLIKGSAPWATHVVEFDVPANAESVEFGMMIRGTGRACFDDARLEIVRAGKNPV